MWLDSLYRARRYCTGLVHIKPNNGAKKKSPTHHHAPAPVLVTSPHEFVFDVSLESGSIVPTHTEGERASKKQKDFIEEKAQQHDAVRVLRSELDVRRRTKIVT